MEHNNIPDYPQFSASFSSLFGIGGVRNAAYTNRGSISSSWRR